MEENIEKDEEENKSFDYKDIVNIISASKKEDDFVYEEFGADGADSQVESTTSNQVAGETIVGKDDDLSWYLGGEDHSYTHTVLELLPLAGIVIGIISFN